MKLVEKKSPLFNLDDGQFTVDILDGRYQG